MTFLFIIENAKNFGFLFKINKLFATDASNNKTGTNNKDTKQITQGSGIFSRVYF